MLQTTEKLYYGGFFLSYKCVTIDLLPERTLNPNIAQTLYLSQIIFTLLDYQVYLSFAFLGDLASILSCLIMRGQSRH